MRGGKTQGEEGKLTSRKIRPRTERTETKNSVGRRGEIFNLKASHITEGAWQSLSRDKPKRKKIFQA